LHVAGTLILEIEIYLDRPSKEWQRDSGGHIMMDILPLDLDALVNMNAI
jgi:catechol-2,3-dioxygenase